MTTKKQKMVQQMIEDRSNMVKDWVDPGPADAKTLNTVAAEVLKVLSGLYPHLCKMKWAVYGRANKNEPWQKVSTLPLIDAVQVLQWDDVWAVKQEVLNALPVAEFPPERTAPVSRGRRMDKPVKPKPAVPTDRFYAWRLAYKLGECSIDRVPADIRQMVLNGG